MLLLLQVFYMVCYISQINSAQDASIQQLQLLKVLFKNGYIKLDQTEIGMNINYHTPQCGSTQVEHQLVEFQLVYGLISTNKSMNTQIKSKNKLMIFNKTTRVSLLKLKKVSIVKYMKIKLINEPLDFYLFKY